MGVLHGVEIVEGEGTVLGVNLGRPIVTIGIFLSCVRDGDALFPNDFGEDLFFLRFCHSLVVLNNRTSFEALLN